MYGRKPRRAQPAFALAAALGHSPVNALRLRVGYGLDVPKRLLKGRERYGLHAARLALGVVVCILVQLPGQHIPRRLVPGLKHIRRHKEVREPLRRHPHDALKQVRTRLGNRRHPERRLRPSREHLRHNRLERIERTLPVGIRPVVVLNGLVPVHAQQQTEPVPLHETYPLIRQQRPVGGYGKPERLPQLVMHPLDQRLYYAVVH